MTTLKNKHIIITGASRGIGRSMTNALYKEGAKLTIFARSQQQLDELASELGDSVKSYAVDLTNISAMEKAVEFAQKMNGPIDILINNAGTGWYKPYNEHTREDNRQIIDLNITAVTELTRICLDDLKKQKGTILNVSSDLGEKPMPNMALYAASKHAVNGLSRSLSRELRHFDIRVLLLSPGMTDSTFGGKSFGDTPPPYAINPDDLAEVAVFMLTRPHYLLLDEVTVHPLKQDF